MPDYSSEQKRFLADVREAYKSQIKDVVDEEYNRILIQSYQQFLVNDISQWSQGDLIQSLMDTWENGCSPIDLNEALEHQCNILEENGSYELSIHLAVTEMKELIGGE